MAINDDKYAALVASGFTPSTTNDMEQKFWALLISQNGGPLSPTPSYTNATYAVSSATSSRALTSTSSGTQLVNATTAAVTITLPAASSNAGKIFTIKKIDSSANTVTIASAGGTIDGVATKVISTQYTSIMLQSDGTNWYILSNN